MSVGAFLRSAIDKIIKIPTYREIPINDNNIQEQLYHLKNWVHNQSFLAFHLDDKILLRLFRLNGYDLDQTKKRLQNYYKVRLDTPEFFENREPLHPRIQNAMETMMMVPLPKMKLDFTRYFIVKLKNLNPENFNFVDIGKLIFIIADIRMRYDDFLADAYIFDYAGVQYSHFLKLHPLLMHKLFNIIMMAYTDNIKQVHIINTSAVSNAIINMGKLVINKKIADSIIIHSSTESLMEYISEDILPEDYGGLEKSVDYLYGKWKKFVESNNDWLKEQDELAAKFKRRIY